MILLGNDIAGDRPRFNNVLVVSPFQPDKIGEINTKYRADIVNPIQREIVLGKDTFDAVTPLCLQDFFRIVFAIYRPRFKKMYLWSDFFD